MIIEHSLLHKRTWHISSFPSGILRRNVHILLLKPVFESFSGYEGLTKLVVAPSETDPQVKTLCTKNIKMKIKIFFLHPFYKLSNKWKI